MQSLWFSSQIVCPASFKRILRRGLQGEVCDRGWEASETHSVGHSRPGEVIRSCPVVGRSPSRISQTVSQEAWCPLNATALAFDHLVLIRFRTLTSSYYRGAQGVIFSEFMGYSDPAVFTAPCC